MVLHCESYLITCIRNVVFLWQSTFSESFIIFHFWHLLYELSARTGSKSLFCTYSVVKALWRDREVQHSHLCLRSLSQYSFQMNEDDFLVPVFIKQNFVQPCFLLPQKFLSCLLFHFYSYTTLTSTASHFMKFLEHLYSFQTKKLS